MNRFGFDFCCPNCGSGVEFVSGSQPVPPAGRATAFTKCVQRGCRKEWLLTVLVQPGKGS